jgi:hypothetical protein
MIVFGCSSAGYDKINVYEMKSFEEITPNSLKVITNREDIQTIHMAVKGAKKHPGIADMADPHYKIDLGGRIYFLWVYEDSGTIMNTENTHTTYGLTKKAAANVYAIISSLYQNDPA